MKTTTRMLFAECNALFDSQIPGLGAHSKQLDPYFQFARSVMRDLFTELDKDRGGATRVNAGHILALAGDLLILAGDKTESVAGRASALPGRPVFDALEVTIARKAARLGRGAVWKVLEQNIRHVPDPDNRETLAGIIARAKRVR